MEKMLRVNRLLRFMVVGLCFNIISGCLAYESDLDTLDFSNIVSMAFVSSDAQVLEATTIILNTLHIESHQSYLTDSHSNLLSTFHEFARNIDQEKVALFAVRDLHDVDRFLDEMHFLHTVTDSHSPYARIVVLLLWNMTKSHILDGDLPDASMNHHSLDDFPSLYVEKWKVAVVSRWHARNSADINGDALIGRISRMVVLPMSYQMYDDSSVSRLSKAFGYSPHVSSSSVSGLSWLETFKEIPLGLHDKLIRVSRIIFFEFNFRKLIAEIDLVLAVLSLLIIVIVLAVLNIVLCITSNSKRKYKKLDDFPPPEKRNSHDYSTTAIAPPVYGYHTTSASMIHRNVSTNSMRSGSISSQSSYRCAVDSLTIIHDLTFDQCFTYSNRHKSSSSTLPFNHILQNRHPASPTFDSTLFSLSADQYGSIPGF